MDIWGIIIMEGIKSLTIKKSLASLFKIEKVRRRICFWSIPLHLIVNNKKVFWVKWFTELKKNISFWKKFARIISAEFQFVVPYALALDGMSWIHKKTTSKTLMAKWIEQVSQLPEMYCHDLEVVRSNNSLVELGFRSRPTSV